MTAAERVIQAVKSRSIATYQSVELSAHLIRMIKQAYFLAGFNTPSNDDIGLLAAKLSSDVCSQFSSLTVEEIAICFELGVEGVYGEYMGINWRTLKRWLKSYQTSDLRYRAVTMREQEKQCMALTRTTESSDRESEDRLLAFVRQQYSEGYPLERMSCSYIYRILERRGLLKDSAEVKWQAMHAAERLVPKQRNNLRFDEELHKSRVRAKAMELRVGAWLGGR